MAHQVSTNSRPKYAAMTIQSSAVIWRGIVTDPEGFGVSSPRNAPPKNGTTKSRRHEACTKDLTAFFVFSCLVRRASGRRTFGLDGGSDAAIIGGQGK